MTLGQLKSMTVVLPGGGTRKHSYRNLWLCTRTGTDLVICRVTKKRSGKRLSAAVAKRHRRFHGAEARGAMEGEMPAPSGRLSEVGLVKELIYYVPEQIKSPEKNKILWHHAFGDTGHTGMRFPPKFYPRLMKDRKGNLFLRRRNGNIYRVTDWIVG
jgi:hypothetical protein